MVHRPLTSHTVSPHTPPTDPFDHLLTNCSVSHVLTWKAPVSVPIQTRFSTSFRSSLKMHLFHNAFTWVSEIVTLFMGWLGVGWGGGGLHLSHGLVGGRGAAKHGTNRRACRCCHFFICWACVLCVSYCMCVFYVSVVYVSVYVCVSVCACTCACEEVSVQVSVCNHIAGGCV